MNLAMIAQAIGPVQVRTVNVCSACGVELTAYKPAPSRYKKPMSSTQFKPILFCICSTPYIFTPWATGMTADIPKPMKHPAL